jgi:DNA-binding LytR/AlgR family response regulator
LFSLLLVFNNNFFVDFAASIGFFLIDFLATGFLKNYTPDKYELVFFDIYMDKLTEIDMAKRIAEVDRN